MKSSHGQAILALSFLVLASATLGAACTVPLPYVKPGPATQGPWWPAGCYSNSSAPQSLYFSGTENVMGNETFYDGSTTCSGTPNGTGTVVREPSYAIAGKECAFLGLPGGHSSLNADGFPDAPSDAYLCDPIPG